MSYLGSCADVKREIAEIECSENTHSSSGSKIYAGHSHPGGATNMDDKAANEVLMTGRLRAGIKTPRTRTDKLERKYASTGTGPK
jgi:hypothetical protein